MKFWTDSIHVFFFFSSAIDKIDPLRIDPMKIFTSLLGFVAIYPRNYPPSTGLILFPLFLLCFPRRTRFLFTLINLYPAFTSLETLETIPDFFEFLRSIISTSILSARTLGLRIFVPFPPCCSSPSIVLIKRRIGLPTFNKQVSNEAGISPWPVYLI